MELQLWRTGFSDICCRLLGAEDHGSMRKMSLSSLQPQPYTAQPCSCFLHQPLPLEENFHMLADPKPTGATRPSPTDFGCKQREGCVQRALPASLFLHLCRTELRQEYGALTLAAGAPIQLSMDMMRHKGNGTNSASTEQSHFKAFQPEDGLGCCVCLRGHTKPALRFHKGMPFKKPYVMIIEFESPSSCSFSWSQQVPGALGSNLQSISALQDQAAALCVRETLSLLPSCSSPDSDFSFHCSCALHAISQLRTNASRKLWDLGRAGGFSVREEVTPFNPNCF
ncbi:uncharacterized protein AAGF69_007635 isoform 2-T2 [Amazona ochrocephala]